jgi:hypothetical protein
MRPILQPSLVNGRFADPALFVDVLFERRALLFDLGDIAALSPCSGPRASSRTSAIDLRLTVVAPESGFSGECARVASRSRLTVSLRRANARTRMCGVDWA